MRTDVLVPGSKVEPPGVAPLSHQCSVPTARPDGQRSAGRRRRIEHERRYVAMLYGRLDERRADTARRLQSVLHDETVGTPQALTERDAAAAMYTDRLAALRAAEHGLAFGRLDTDTGERRYIGRLGLLDEEHEYEPLLMDWRAPGGAAVLHRHRGVARGHAPPPAPAHPPPRGRRPSTTRCSTSPTPPRRAQHAGSTGEAALMAAVVAPGAPAGWATSSRPSRPSRTGSSGPRRPACWWCRAGRAPARPRWPCTGPPTCSTPTATGSPGAASSSSARTPRSCATSGRCCRRWGRPASCSAPSGSCSPASTRAVPRRPRWPR